MLINNKIKRKYDKIHLSAIQRMVGIVFCQKSKIKCQFFQLLLNKDYLHLQKIIYTL